MILVLIQNSYPLVARATTSVLPLTQHIAGYDWHRRGFWVLPLVLALAVGSVLVHSAYHNHTPCVFEAGGMLSRFQVLILQFDSSSVGFTFTPASTGTGPAPH